MRITVEEVAMVCHELNRQYCRAIGDHSQPSWESAPPWQKASVITGVNLHILNPDITPEESHEAWMATKVADGWKLGLVKDVDKKEHPCMRPYNELPLDQRIKDSLFKGLVNHFSRHAAIL